MRTYPVVPGVPAAGHLTAGGNWHPGRAEGCVKCPAPPQTRTLQRSDIQRCPKRSFSPRHYNNDGSCKCQPKGDQQ